jgi:hypothetical protein
MDESTESQLRDALAELGSVRFEQADVLKSPELLERRREAGRVVTKLFVDAGLDVRQLETVQSQYRSELHRVAEERRLDAVSKSSVSRDIVHKALDAKRRLIDAGGILVPAGVRVERRPVTLDKPFLIVPSSAFISGDQIAPFDSWAKFEFTRKHSAEDVIHFYYIWENPTDAAVQIDVSTSVGFCGFCKTHAEGSFYNSTETRLSIFCALVVWPWSHQPANTLADLADDVLRISATSDSVFDGDSGGPMNLTQDLRSASDSWLTISPRELVVFEVAVVFESHVEENGNVSVDFNDGSFHIASPFLSVGMWPAP